MAQLMREFAGIDRAEVFVGIRGKRGSQKDPSENLNLAEIAAVNEFGGGNVPERSFLRSTVDENEAAYTARIEDIITNVIDGKRGLDQGLNLLGLKVTGDVQRKIRDLKTPVNAPLTIALKGSANPLIDTGRMRQSIDYEVVKS